MKRPKKKRSWPVGAGIVCVCASLAVAESETYTVQTGDTLGEIAERFEVTPQAIQLHNDLSSPDRIVAGNELRIPPGPDVPLRYTVVPGDTLGWIARQHGVTVQEVVALNEMADPDDVSAGQEILIPGSARNKVEVLPVNVQRELDRIRVLSGWSHVVIHHSGTKRGNIRGLDRYHREERRMVNGLGYHFVIGNGNGMPDGAVGIGPRWTRQQAGGHLASEAQNRYSIGICLIGNFEQHQPTANQINSLRALVRYLQRRCDITTQFVTTHTRINIRPTRCPGRHFPTEAFLKSL